jgi:hypothetical protein
MVARSRFWTTPQFWVEAFVTSNLGVLAFDIFLAHSVNEFRRPAEYIPLIFSAVAPIVLVLGLFLRHRWGYFAAWRDLGYLIGWSSVLVGLAGVVFHLDSRFFYERTIQSLTYTAPFAAPLAYAGLGFLLIVNRMVETESEEWSRWIVFFTLGGFFGNLVLSLTDHAENGFFRNVEWIPVISSAFAVGFLAVPLFMSVKRRFLELSALVLLVQAAVGVLGFMYHAEANLRGPSGSFFHDIVYGAPPMAPLLFPNLVVLGFIGLWSLLAHVPDEESLAVLIIRLPVWVRLRRPERGEI